ncbi:TetR/AcrR family transcriptional regulator [Streptomyces prunicolor]|jgi:AcrR family transcriptional regulator|uniref:TetR/AcrR family transcriptional regulator n=1 Tax=Streptomyces prunicolor TaxID=67348 RepID=UPI00341DBF2B
MSRKQERAVRTYELVLDAAATEFARRGYQRTNLQDVALSTGLTKGALYGHFSSKEVLAATLTEMFDRELTRLADEAAAEHDSAIGQLCTFVRRFAVRLYTDVRISAALRLSIDQAIESSQPPTCLNRLRRHISRLVTTARQDGQLKAGCPAEPLADLLVAALVGAHYTAPAEADPLPERVSAMWRLILPCVTDPGPG